MSIVEQIKSLSWEQFLVGLFAIMGAIAPGMLLTYLYKPELFLELEFLKLVVFSLAFTLPVLTLNLVVSVKVADEKESELDISGSALLLSATTFYTALLAAYFFHVPFKGFLLILVILEIALCIVEYVIYKRKGSKGGQKT